MVWIFYIFFYNGVFLYCGINVFEFFKIVEGWKIFYIIDICNIEGCLIEVFNNWVEIDMLLNIWYWVVVMADVDGFFSKMA